MEIQVNDVVQINKNVAEDRSGWIGAFVSVTGVLSWGIQGFVHCINDHRMSTRAYIILRNNQFDYIGKTVLSPSNSI